jgi:transcriptional regulator with XRE-family HTH domain
MNIGSKLRGLRESYGLTQQHLGERCNLSRVAICKIENSRPECLRLLTVDRVCKALGTTVQSLLD